MYFFRVTWVEVQVLSLSVKVVKKVFVFLTRITAKIYRDCRGIAFNGPDFGVFGGTNGGNGCGDYKLTITRNVAITKICIFTNYC